MAKKNIRIIAISLTILFILGVSLVGCDSRPRDNIKVNTSTTQAHVYGRNGYKPGKVDVQFNEEDGSYTVIIRFNPPTDYIG